MPADVRALKDVRRFQSEVSYLSHAPDPLAARLTIYVIAAAFLALAVIAVFGKIDRVVTSVSGRIVNARGPMVFQALDQSIVKSLNVREGDRVSKGEVLATLDPTFAQADVSQLKQQAASLRAEIARASAELSGAPLQFPTIDDADQLHYNGLQRDLYRDRQAQYQAQTHTFDEKIAGTAALLAKLHQDVRELGEESEVARQVEKMRTTLLSKGAGSLLNELSSKAVLLEAKRTEDGQRASIAETEHQLSELSAEREAFVRSWAGDLRKELVTAQNALDVASAQLEKAALHKNLVELRAGEDAIVLTLAKTSVGSVLREGDLLYSAMPLDGALEADVHILARDIGFVRPGDRVTLKVDAFNYSEHGTAEGVVKWISESAFFVSEDTGQPTDAYYEARVDIRNMKFIRVPDSFRLIPGMTLVADINVGRRSLARYLMDGMVRGADEAMREP